MKVFWDRVSPESAAIDLEFGRSRVSLGPAPSHGTSFAVGPADLQFPRISKEVMTEGREKAALDPDARHSDSVGWAGRA